MTADERLQAGMALIARRYLERTLKELEQLHEDIEGLRAGDRARLKELAGLAHAIHGTSALFGFQEISDYAARIERLVEAIDNDGPEREALIEIDSAATQLSRAVQQAALRARN